MFYPGYCSTASPKKQITLYCYESKILKGCCTAEIACEYDGFYQCKLKTHQSNIITFCWWAWMGHVRIFMHIVRRRRQQIVFGHFVLIFFCGMVLSMVVWFVKLSLWYGALNFGRNRWKFALRWISDGDKAICALDQEPKTKGAHLYKTQENKTKQIN